MDLHSRFTATTEVVDADGEVMASYVTSKTIQNVVYPGEEYTVHSGGTTSGVAESGKLGDAEKIATVTAERNPRGRRLRGRRPGRQAVAAIRVSRSSGSSSCPGPPGRCRSP
ncbi:hypothetical protein GCM10017771_06100 [Streptomyces capitiformicae]|uniref:Uncharacterized protein n=1 Tax=Streptomyces capitiformicae TaxID=2014920 RepID=A0A919L385_9ACTN|nr:hypothetical protein GCM10017771_06100 [Streptomyces capitiformicae]